MNILIFAASSWISSKGAVGGLAAALPDAHFTRKVVGNSVGTQFAFYGDFDFTRFDAAVFSCLGPDEMYFEKMGNYDYVASLYYELFSTIQAQTNLYVAGMPLTPYLEQASEVACMQAEAAAMAGARYVSVREFALEHGRKFVPEGAPLMADVAHLQTAIAWQYGRHLGRIIAEANGQRRPARSFAHNFRGVEAGRVFEGKTSTRGERLFERNFAEMGLGDRLRFGAPGRPVGLYFDYWQTYSFARFSGAHGSLVQRLYHGNDASRLQLQFIPVPGEMLFDELEIVSPQPAYRDAHSVNLLPDTPPPIASICGIAFWNGEIRDFERTRRGLSVLPYAIPALEPTIPLVLCARDIPAARGWHPPVHRPDVGWTRLTGPEAESRLVVDCAPGSYALRLRVLGAASYDALAGLGICVDGVAAAPEIGRHPEAGYVVTAAFTIATAGRKTIALKVPAMRDGYGLEVGQVEFYAGTGL